MTVICVCDDCCCTLYVCRQSYSLY